MLSAKEVMNVSKIIPVISVNETKNMLQLAEALIEGGVNIFEITLRTPNALKVIEAVVKEFPDAITGAGTVMSPDSFKAVSDIGAKFAISPGLTPALAKAADGGSISLLPGVATASEIMSGIEYGFDAFKLYPATIVGGVDALKAFGGPFKDIVFCPTGGINADNAKSFLNLDNVPCVGGSWIVPNQLVDYEKFYEVTRLTKEALELLE
ncbi:bifunctional 4-hydroxy-2-oxoglutarate aldolase/2-dehydro-3-deoxy-phosphogluconate aldolase [Sulfurimonas aquatica]|uniref:2-dehydro-3-deoxy-phosphogluconate aldolase n=1 Tax=Sulfurimonas aquatica TaxID=2672570 RepID=A0A975B1U5_9BACT|nr:bifunctional 4-hydroxy-2-oxoglutarate aldolase/2-dehydro-3-deoxy-phosphogluconate aldolase [Sulfurimonas aquatica]QSZ42679.1 bifunctional 4-hydroxy-2-oxoglutarate aldolase/2-dehydro-3-deoxy-phosphogluconate aldolase [Sulfurimonas aquatica]